MEILFFKKHFVSIQDELSELIHGHSKRAQLPLAFREDGKRIQTAVGESWQLGFSPVSHQHAAIQRTLRPSPPPPPPLLQAFVTQPHCHLQGSARGHTAGPLGNTRVQPHTLSPTSGMPPIGLV